MTLALRESIYQICLDFLRTAESKRRWNMSSDIPWDRLDISKATKTVAQRVELFCTEELYVPDYSYEGLNLSRAAFGMACFQTRWAFEESKHGMAFREYLIRSGLRSEADLAGLETQTFSRRWKLPFPTVRRMACYGALQEGATYTAYNVQRNIARSTGDGALETIFFLLGRDEAAHAGFYRSMIQLELAEDRGATIADLAYVLSNFKMPGDGLIPNYVRRLQCSGAGISPRLFLARVVWPLLNILAISREEMKMALKQGCRG